LASVAFIRTRGDEPGGELGFKQPVFYLMSRLVLNREQARLVDLRAIDAYAMSGLVLMENAGRGAVDVWLQAGFIGPVVVCCGRGNNGGDGFVMARHLELRGVAVRIVLLAEPNSLTGDAAANYEIARRSGLAMRVLPGVPTAVELDAALNGAGSIVDALLGTGAQGEPRPPFAAAIDAMNRSGRPILAVDVPSGLDCDTGVAAASTVRAARTATFVAAKPGFLLPEAAPYVGQLHIVSIGVPKKLLEEFHVCGS
jgi:NAD(P)H-hydrate epimerase